MSRRTLRILARIALGAFLFVQAAMAMAACDLGRHTAAQAIQSAAAADSHPCHEQQSNPSDASLCVAHCVTQAQSLEKPFWKAPATAPAPVLPMAVLPPPALARATALDLPLALAGPPRRILFRSLLI
jgi:hypothetical protein